MARKRSKQRKAERNRRRRKMLDALVGRAAADKILSGACPVSDFTPDLGNVDAVKAARLSRQLIADQL